MRLDGKRHSLEVIVDEQLDQALAVIRPKGEYTGKRLVEISRRLSELTHDSWTVSRGHLILPICAWISKSGIPYSTMVENVASKYRALTDKIDRLFAEGDRKRARKGKRRRATRRKSKRRTKKS